MKRITILLGAGFLSLGSMVYAAVPQLINFQGILRNGSGNPVANGSYSVVFTVYDAPSGGTNLWTETQSITTTGGLFNVLLGSTNPVPDSAFNDISRYLGVKVGADPEMTPRQQLVSLSYAFRVNSVDGASGGTITSKVSIGPGHTNTGTNAFVAGESNAVSGDYSSVGGGYGNNAGGLTTTIGGGDFNNASGFKATVGGGGYNSASGGEATVGGGGGNSASGERAVVAGGAGNTASAQGATVGGGLSNHARGLFSVVSGGGGATAADSNTAWGDYSTISGGRGNMAASYFTTVSGGSQNTAIYNYSTVAGGLTNTANGFYSTVSGGVYNSASYGSSTVGGGEYDSATYAGTTVGGGSNNVARGYCATVPGGLANAASGYSSFAAGRQAKALHDGSFVWGDYSSYADFTSTAANQFLIRAAGGMGIGTNAPEQLLSVAGGMNLDQSNLNTGTVSNSLRFGSNSGEAIASKRDAGGNQFGLDFYTASINRMSIVNATGNVGIATAAPTSKLHVNGSFATAVRTVVINTILDENDNVVLCNAPAPMVVSLPTASSCPGRQYAIKVIGGNLVTIDPFGSEAIDGAATKMLDFPRAMTIISNGANWYILSHNHL